MITANLNDLRAIISRLQRNYVGYWDRYPVLITIVTIAAMADFISTVHFMHHHGVHQELHPGIRIAAEEMGPVAGAFLGKLAQLGALFFVTIYLRPLARLLFFVATVMYAWAAWYNIWGRDLYTPLLIHWLHL